MIEVRLFELSIKGNRLDEINAEEVLNRQALTQARISGLRQRLHHLSCRLAKGIAKPQAAIMAPFYKMAR